MLQGLKDFQIDPNKIVCGKRLGNGGHGDVFIGELSHNGTKEPVTVKVVKPTINADTPGTMSLVSLSIFLRTHVSWLRS